MLPLSPVPATPYVEQLNIGVGRRALAISLAILIPALMLLLLLVFGVGKLPDRVEERVSMVSLQATEVSADAHKSSSPKPEPTEDRPTPPKPAAEKPQPSQTPPLPAPPIPTPPIPTPNSTPAPPASPPSPIRPSSGRVYGPPDTGGSPGYRDTERVGTAPNGDPLYAAAWYREPSDGELRGYLSTASGPGWGLIACRTAPDYRVEDCVGIDEYPTGSQIMRAVLAAAWQFKVRPPRVGGRQLVGAWVRIRIDYGVRVGSR